MMATWLPSEAHDAFWQQIHAACTPAGELDLDDLNRLLPASLATDGKALDHLMVALAARDIHLVDTHTEQVHQRRRLRKVLNLAERADQGEQESHAAGSDPSFGEPEPDDESLTARWLRVTRALGQEASQSPLLAWHVHRALVEEKRPRESVMSLKTERALTATVAKLREFLEDLEQTWRARRAGSLTAEAWCHQRNQVTDMLREQPFRLRFLVQSAAEESAWLAKLFRKLRRWTAASLPPLARLLEDASGTHLDVWQARSQRLQHWVARRNSLRQELVSEHYGLAVMVSRSYVGRGLPLEDLLQAALVGLTLAIDRHDFSRPSPLAATATPLMRKRIRKMLRHDVAAVSRSERDEKMLRAIRRMEQQVQSIHGIVPKDTQLARWLELDLDDVRRVRGLRRRSESLQKSMPDSEDLTLEDSLYDPRTQPERELEAQALRERLWQFLTAHLTTTDAEAVFAAWGLDPSGRTLGELASDRALPAETLEAKVAEAIHTLRDAEAPFDLLAMMHR